MTKQKIVLSIISIIIVSLIAYFTTTVVAIPIVTAISLSFVMFSKNDKTRHVYAGTFISLLVGAELFRFTDIALGWACVVGVISAAIAGGIKEFVWDRELKKGASTTMDFLVTIFGGALGAVLLAMIYGFLLSQ